MNWFAFGQSLAEGHRQQYELNEQRAIENFNIEVQRQNARLKGQQTSAAEEAQRRSSRQVLGAERAGIAEAGVGFGGSSLDIMRRSTANAELDALNIRYAGDLERLGILNDIEMRKYHVTMLDKAAKQVMIMRWGAALSSLFGGAGGMQQSSSNYQMSFGNSSSGMSYSAPSTSSGASWGNAYGASSYAGSGYSSWSGPYKSGG
jgi:hypothetical protein